MIMVKVFMALLGLILIASLVLTIVDRAARPEVAKMANLSTIIALFAIIVGLLTSLIDEVVTIFHVM